MDNEAIRVELMSHRQVLNALRRGLQMFHPEDPNRYIRDGREEIERAIFIQMGLIEKVELEFARNAKKIGS